jgi:hypothetical protein
MKPQKQLRVLVLALGVGCGDAGRQFNGQYGAALCERMEECVPGVLDAAFGTEVQCATSIEGRLDGFLERPECHFDSDAAETCLSQLDSMSCDRWVYGYGIQTCNEVYVCESVPQDDGSQYYDSEADVGE